MYLWLNNKKITLKHHKVKYTAAITINVACNKILTSALQGCKKDLIAKVAIEIITSFNQ